MRLFRRAFVIAILFITFNILISGNAKAEGTPYDNWLAVFDPVYYEAHSSEAAAYAGGNNNKLWEHFVKYGIPRGVQGNEEFNLAVYRVNYPELVKVYGENLIKYYIHYATIGKAEGRNAKYLLSEQADITLVDLPKNESQYRPDQIGFMIIGESHVTVLGASKMCFGADKSISSNVPKTNYATLSIPGFAPDFWGGGVHIKANGKDYEAFSYINEEMEKYPNVELWYIVYFAGTNTCKIKGDAYAIKCMQSDLEKLAKAKFCTKHELALITTAHMYGRDNSYILKFDNYANAEIQKMTDLGLEGNCYDARADYDSYTLNKRLIGSEFPKFRNQWSGDGVHFYGSQYWTVTVKACNQFFDNMYK